MDSLFLILFFISFLAILIGMIKPNFVLSWAPEAKRKRKYVAMYFGIATVAFFILFGITTPSTSESAVKNEQIEIEDEEANEAAKKEEEEEAKAKEEAEVQAKKEAEEQAKKEAEDAAKKEAEEQAKKEAEEKAKKEAEEQARKEAEEKAKNAETMSQTQAVKVAKDYLNYTAFSRIGLIEQLEYEGFSNPDATYAVDKLNVDWQVQAVKMAEDYLDYTAFSRSGLIEQLVYEGFSNADATYAVDEVGL